MRPRGNAGAGPAEPRLRRMKRRAVLRLCRKLLSVRTHVARHRLRQYRRREVAQHARLQELIAYCVTRVPYYRTACAALGLQGSVEFSDLPILDKVALRENFADLIAVGRAGAVLAGTPLWITKTSRSTGVPSSYLRSQADLVANNAALASIFAEHRIRPYGHLFDLGLHRKDQTIVEARAVPGAFLFWNFTGYSFDRAALLEECAAIMACARPRVIYGAPSRIIALARLCESRSIELRPAIIISTYEHLSATGAALLRRVFGCVVVQVYGTSETGPVAWTCGHGRLHFDPRLAAVELVDADGAYVARGDTGRVLLTPVDIRPMPLLRFDTGDLAVRPMSACPCGKPAPSIERLEGRTASMIETANGERLSPFAVYGFVDAVGVAESQIIQPRPGELRVVFPARTSLPATVVEHVSERIRGYLGEDMDVLFSHDGGFVYTASGKRNAFVSMVGPP